MASFGFGARHIIIGNISGNLTFEQRAQLRWAAIQGARNEVDFLRAELLDEAFHHGDCDENAENGLEPLHSFLNNVLGVMKGKKTSKFVRMALAFQRISDLETWQMLGGQGVVLLARVDGRRRGRIITRVNKAMKRTKGVSICCATFRTILIDILGEDGYAAVLIETGANRTRNRARPQLRTLRSFVLKMASRIPELERAVRRNKEVEKIVYPPSAR